MAGVPRCCDPMRMKRSRLSGVGREDPNRWLAVCSGLTQLGMSTFRRRVSRLRLLGMGLLLLGNLSNAWGQPILAEDFEDGVLDTRISVTAFNTFSAGIKDTPYLAGSKAFGFGLSGCSASCFSSHTTTVTVDLGAPTAMGSITFKYRELYSDWGSLLYVSIDGQVVGGAGPSTAPPGFDGPPTFNAFVPDPDVSSITILADRVGQVVTFHVTDITNTSEMYIDDLVVNPPSMTSGLVAHYPFSGDASDATGGGRDGLITGATLTTDRFGSTNSAYHFDGDGDFIGADADGLPSGERTAALWFRADSLATLPVMMGYGAGCDGSWFLGLNGANVPGFYAATHCAAYWVRFDCAPQTGVWTHFAAVADAGGSRLYLNGELVAQNPNPAPSIATAGAQFGIGVASSTSGTVPYTDGNIGYFAGDIDDVRIYDRALSAGELQTLAGGAAPITCAQPQCSQFPPAGPDTFQTDAVVTVQIPALNLTDVVALSGPTVISRGTPFDPGDGRREVPTEMVSLDLTGASPVLGALHVIESPTLASTGLVKSQSAGVDFPADSFFDVFFEIETTLPPPLNRLRNAAPLRMRQVIDCFPPLSAIYQPPPGGQRIPLLDGADQQVATLIHAQHEVLSPFCGNGLVDSFEECDDGNGIDCDGCDRNCTLTRCGNGVVCSPEQCDDGNTTALDGCSAVCQLEAICGNGALEPSEQCDDGNAYDGDCCSAFCQYEAAGSGCTPDATLCSTDRCDGAGTCAHIFEPNPSCLLPVESQRASLKVLKKTTPTPDQLQFKWRKGPIVAKAAFGAPDTSTSYELCVYDESAGVSSLALAARPQLGGTCDGKACWTEKPKGWRYKASIGAQPDGVTSVLLGQGLVAGEAKIQVKAKGDLVLPPLPLAKDPRVSAEVRTSTGQCFGARFTAATKNDGGQFKATSD